MAEEGYDALLQPIRDALAAADMQRLRDALLTLTNGGRRALEQRLGPAAVARLLQNARSVRRGVRGRVVVIHGIMGGKLASVDPDGDEALVWVNVLRLISGAIERFRLDGDGKGAVDVVTRGLLDEYLPLVMELDREWQVLPFAFDWRLDIDESAERLHEAIGGWARGEPAHIVAHSMGGLVARRFTQLHGDAWAAMLDSDGGLRGGRLLMLGTPNRGSFAIPFVLTGREPVVRKLAKFDIRHDLDELLDIINTFVGSYQMLPTPRLVFDDDRLKLYTDTTWGAYPVTQKNLQRGRVFQELIDAVVTPERLLYVAGYDQPTPYRIRVDAPGDFSYQETPDGDGRVPHELGKLPEVTTYYVPELHGDLPKNERVLAAIHDLLRKGRTTALETQLPASRRAVRSRAWRKADEVAPDVGPPVEGILGTRGGGRVVETLTAAQQGALETILVQELVGGAPQPEAALESATGVVGSSGEPAAAMRALNVEVMWGNITQADGEVYVAGHYQGVMPNRGELALDKVVSRPSANAEQRVITSHTRRGVVRGAVGDVYFFPWNDSGARFKTVVIAGMGHPGTFGRAELKRLSRSLTESLLTLPGVTTINTLLLGSGAGNLPVRFALEALLAGMAEALEASTHESGITKVRIVEQDRTQAECILQMLKKIEHVPLTRGVLKLVPEPDVVTGSGGTVNDDLILSMLLAAVAKTQRSPEGAETPSEVLGAIPMELRDRASKALVKLGESKADLLATAAQLRLQRQPQQEEEEWQTPTRVSFVYEKGGVRSAALTDTAVVPERFVALDWLLVNELVQNLTDARDLSKLAGMSALLARLVVPRDFRDLFSSSKTTIFEVDCHTARIQWEMLGLLRSDTRDSVPIALERQVARQLRTFYSPAPTRAADTRTRLRALVIGDPGDPAKAESLPGARREAMEIAALLQTRGAEVTLLIGCKSARDGLAGYAPASRLELLRLLNEQQFEILHYAGHGDFDAADPESRAGWVFADGLLTSRELERVDLMPSLVVANACLSGLVSNALEGSSQPAGRLHLREEYLLPGLADEFFKRGVRNYVGTAWEVSDLGAITFASELYGALLPRPLGGAEGKTLGEAMLRARKKLKSLEINFGALWGAYQHYGDPDFRLAPPPEDSARVA